MRILLQHIGRQHQKARRAVAALQAVVLDEGALQRMQFVAVGEPFDGADFLALGLDGEHQAGAHRLVVDDDRAGAADAMLAADMGAGLPAIVANGVDQSAARLDADRIIPAVDVERDVEFFVHRAVHFGNGQPLRPCTVLGRQLAARLPGRARSYRRAARPARDRRDRRLHIQNQPLGLAAAAADHDLVVGRLLFFAEHGIAVFRNAGDHAGHAGAADAELAGIIDIDAGVEQHFEDLLALGDVIFLARARELDPEAAGGRGFGLGGEIFDMDLAARPVGRGRLECGQHRLRPAAIQMRVFRRRGDDRGKVEEFAVRPRRRNAAALFPGRIFAAFRETPSRRATGTNNRASTAADAPIELLRHAPDRRDADAAGDQHDVFGVLDQRKIIARRADLDLVADAHLVEDVDASRRGLPDRA